MEILIYICYTNHSKFKNNQYYKIITKKKIGEGSYGHIYEINDQIVIKIFKYKTDLSATHTELIPSKKENRELNFFIQYIQKAIQNNTFIIHIYAIGLLKSSKWKEHYCLFLPYCLPLSKLLKKYTINNSKQGKIFTLQIMKRLIEIELYLNKQYDVTNCDIKLNNFMIEKNKELHVKNIIGIDFGLIKKRNSQLYTFHTKYFIWPYKKKITLDCLSSYSICINGMQLLFPKTNQIKDNLLSIKKDIDFYHIFYNGLILQVKVDQLYLLIQNYLKKI